MMGNGDWFLDLFGAFAEGEISNNKAVAKLMIRAGLAPVLIKPNDKKPLCTLTTAQIKKADTEAQDAARAAGHQNWDRVTHASSFGTGCGLHHALTSERELTHTRIKELLTAGANLAVSFKHSKMRVLLIDVDTDSERIAFLTDANMPLDTPLTVTTPGVFDTESEVWKHKNGGHIWMPLPEGVELPERKGKASWCRCHQFSKPSCENAWAAYWGSSYVLVPPSVRPEGPYRVTGSAIEAPKWLTDLLSAAPGTDDSAPEGAEALNTDSDDSINGWSARTSWGELLTADGWSTTGQVDNCGCDTWTRPGATNDKSATAHDVGCSRYKTDTGHAPIHSWSDAVRWGGKDTASKLTYVAWARYDGDTSAAMRDLGISAKPSSGGDDLFVLGEASSASASTDDDGLFVLGSAEGKGNAPDTGANHESKGADTQNSMMDMLRASIVNWSELLTEDFGDVEWLAGKLMTKGQQVALVGDGKAGKSMFAQEWMWRMSAGLPFLGDAAREPVKVLYLDNENGRPDLQERFRSFGVDMDTLPNLMYASFPPMPALDTVVGGQLLLALVRETGAQVVVIDTVSRFISGAENDADTWLALYRNTLMLLKGAGIASVRLDHFGKDKEKGARGSSGKTQDVDHVWELAVTDVETSKLTLKRTHTRTGIGDGVFAIHREGVKSNDRWVDGSTRHVLSAAPDPFVLEGSAPSAGRPEEAMVKIMDLLKARDEGMSKNKIEEAMRGTGKETIGAALKLLEEEGHLTIQVGSRNAKLCLWKAEYVPGSQSE